MRYVIYGVPTGPPPPPFFRPIGPITARPRKAEVITGGASAASAHVWLLGTEGYDSETGTADEVFCFTPKVLGEFFYHVFFRQMKENEKLTF